MWVQLIRNVNVEGQHCNAGDRIDVSDELGTALINLGKARRSFPPPSETLLEPANPPGNNPGGDLHAAAVVEVIEDEAASEVAMLAPSESAVLPKKARAKKSL